MAITLSQLKAVSKPLTVTHEGIPINLRYSPSKHTPDFELVLDDNESHRVQCRLSLLSELVTHLDILADKHGTKTEIYNPTLWGLGHSLRNKKATEIIKDLSLGDAPVHSSGRF